MTYKKNYIGKGKRNEKINSIVKFTISMEELERVAYDYEGKKYVSFETTEMNSPDKYGRTHTAWVPLKVEEETSEEAPVETPKPKAKK